MSMAKWLKSIMLGISGWLSMSMALAAESADKAPAHGSFLSMLPMLLIFVVIFYFLLIRPQSKRAKEQKQLLSNVAVGDEVLTAGGIVGKVLQLKDNFIVLNIGKNVEITLRKSSIASVLPKGTMES
jgi:preprotein translocase subunit YajC